MEGSVFSGQSYNPNQNTVTHYKEGQSHGTKKKKNKNSTKKPKVKSVATVKINPHDKYTETSVFKR